MKRLFEIIGLLSLVIFSFFITNKTALVVKNMDDIMIEIKHNYKKYNKKPIDAYIKDNQIIPGISGTQVDINKSYKAMKEYGRYNDKLYVFKYIKPKQSIEKNKNKTVISGNRNIRQVSISFVLKNNSDISNILNILDRNKIKANFFIDDTWLTNNNYLTIDLINKGYIMGINSNGEYNSWIDTVIRHVGKQKEGYCLFNKENDCSKLDNYIIHDNIYSRNYLYNIKKDIHNGSIILMNVNNELEKELESIINFIKSKGYTIVNLEKILTE